jgi:methionyl-tRNA synthetase
VTTQPDEAAMVLRTAINLIKYCALAAEPVMPFTAAAVLRALHVAERERQGWIDPVDLESHGPGRPFDVPDLLFHRIDAKEVEALEAQFAGV